MTKWINDSATRRGILRTALAVASGTAAAAAATTAWAQDKLAQAQAQYQDTPKDGNVCSKCVNFVTPNACKIVAGTISPNGWCVAFAPKDS